MHYLKNLTNKASSIHSQLIAEQLSITSFSTNTYALEPELNSFSRWRLFSLPQNSLLLFFLFLSSFSLFYTELFFNISPQITVYKHVTYFFKIQFPDKISKFLFTNSNSASKCGYTKDPNTQILVLHSYLQRNSAYKIKLSRLFSARESLSDDLEWQNLLSKSTQGLVSLNLFNPSL